MGTSDSTITRGWWRENGNSSESAWKAISSHPHCGPCRARQQRRGTVRAGASLGSGHSPTGKPKVPCEHVGHLLTIIRTESCREIKVYKAFLAFLPVVGAILTFIGGAGASLGSCIRVPGTPSVFLWPWKASPFPPGTQCRGAARAEATMRRRPSGTHLGTKGP